MSQKPSFLRHLRVPLLVLLKRDLDTTPRPEGWRPDPGDPLGNVPKCLACVTCGCHWALSWELVEKGKYCPVHGRESPNLGGDVISPEEQWYGFAPIEQHLMIATSHLSDAQELAGEDEELVDRLNQAKAVIIEELEKQRRGRSGP